MIYILISYAVFQGSDYIPSRLLISSCVSKNDVLYIMCFLAGFNYVRTLDLRITVSRPIPLAKQIRYDKPSVFFFRYVKSKCSLKLESRLIICEEGIEKNVFRKEKMLCKTLGPR